VNNGQLTRIAGTHSSRLDSGRGHCGLLYGKRIKESSRSCRIQAKFSRRIWWARFWEKAAVISCRHLESPTLLTLHSNSTMKSTNHSSSSRELPTLNTIKYDLESSTHFEPLLSHPLPFTLLKHLNSQSFLPRHNGDFTPWFVLL
jgi:hypothetical protein